jgi:aflatoxin B synthase
MGWVLIILLLQTVSAISSFFLAMALYPDAQQKAREELDKVIGPSSLPRFSDREKLPYIEALIKEVYRWNPVGPLGGYLYIHLISDDKLTRL